MKAGRAGSAARVRRGGLLASGLISAVAVGVGAGLNLVLILIVGRSYGAADTGVFFAAIGVFLIAANALKLGADTGAVRALSRLTALQREGDVRATLTVACLPVLLVGIAAALFLWGAAPALLSLPARWGGTPPEASTVELVRALAPFVPLFAVLGVTMAATRGLGGVGAFALVQNVLVPAGRVGGVLVAASLGWSVLGAARSWAATLPLLLLVGVAILAARLRRLHGGWLTAASGASLGHLGREFWSFALPRAGAALLEITVEWLDVLLVALLAGPAPAGLYAIATRCMKVPMLADYAMRITVAPAISAAMARRDISRVQGMFESLTRLFVVLAWSYVVLVVVFGDVVMGIFGGDFGAGADLLVVLGLGMAILGAAGPLQSILLLSGLSRLQLANKAAALAVCVVGNLLFTPRAGALGAAAVWTCTVALDTALAAWQVRRRLGIRGGLAPVVTGAVCAVPGMGLAAIGSRALLGPSSAALLAAAIVGSALVGVLAWRLPARTALVGSKARDAAQVGPPAEATEQQSWSGATAQASRSVGGTR